MSSLPPRRLILLIIVLLAGMALAACGGSGQPRETSPTPVVTPAPSPTVTITPAPTPQAPNPSSAASGQQAHRHVVALAEEIGSRPAGSAAEEEAARYIAGQLNSYGYETEVIEFQVETYVEEASNLEITAPEPVLLHPRALSFSKAGEVTAELAAAGIGHPDEFPPEGLDGRIALVERGELTFAEKVQNAADSGATAVIIYNNQPGPFSGDLSTESVIPALAIPREEGQQLLPLLEQGPVTVRLSVEGGRETLSSQNVIGRPERGECSLVVGAHYDSVTAGPGANDNASGVATLLETARVLAAHHEEDATCFVAFGAEEVGLLGSHDFVNSLTEAEQSRVHAMINLDMVGVGDEWQLAGSPDLAESLDDAASLLSLDPLPIPGGNRTFSDQESFIGAGVPAVLIHRSDDPNYHSENDRAEFVDPHLLEEAAELALLALEVGTGR